MKRERGFTLIELLVVIAIIGILSSIVLASLNSARNKGADAAVKANLSNIRGQAEIIYDSDNDYDAVCGANGVTQNAVIIQALAAAQSAGGAAPVCGKPASGVANAWAITGQMKSINLVNGTSGTDYWCVDSSGASKLVTDPIAGTAVACP